MNIFSSFTRVFQHNWLKIGRYVPGYFLQKRVSGFVYFHFSFKVMASLVGGNTRVQNIKLENGAEKKPNHIWKIGDTLFEGDV